MVLMTWLKLFACLHKTGCELEESAFLSELNVPLAVRGYAKLPIQSRPFQ